MARIRRGRLQFLTLLERAQAAGSHGQRDALLADHDERGRPIQLQDPGQLGEVTKDGEDKAQGKTTSAGGAGPEGSWTLDFVRVDGKWYAARNRDLN